MDLNKLSTATSLVGYFRPAAGASFALIDKLPVLFSEDDQKLFELNEIAAFIWCSMQEEVPLEVICHRLIDRGLNRTEARDSLCHALSQWLDEGLVVPQVDASELAFGACVGRRVIEVRASDVEIFGHLRSLFVTTTVPGTTASATFTVYRLGNTAVVMLDGRKVLDCTFNALAPTFRAYLVQHLLLANNERDVIFHAAAITSGDHGLLISAPPGTGKSTLTMHLLNAGFEFGADDIVLIGAEGSVRGVPFAPTLKSGSWSLIGDLRPNIADVPIHDRLDGASIRYLDVGSSYHDGAIHVSWIIFLERSPEYRQPKLVELSEIDAFRQIIGASFASDGKLSKSGFHILKNMVSQARSFVLHYTEAAQGANRLIGLCDGRL